MSEPGKSVSAEHHGRSWGAMLAMAALGLPGIVMRAMGLHSEPLVDALIFGTSILAAAFLLSWAVEALELDISQGLALAIIALIAVLPEYAVDAVLAWREGADYAAAKAAGLDPRAAVDGLAIANMTGGNRLLIGVAWPLVFVVAFYRTRIKELVVDPQRALELLFLAVATAYVILIPLRHTVTIIDTIVLVSLFLCYVFFTAKVKSEEVLELVGPSRAIGALNNGPRRLLTVILLVFSAAVIFASAEPFAEGLVHTGEEFGISKFLLIQWLAPLASESPEVMVAALLAWRGRASVGMGALISSKVNQWTLLIGTLPVAFLLSAGEFSFTGGLPLDNRQREEIFLTAAQSAFAIAVFINLKMGPREAAALFVLFATQLFITNELVRLYYAAAYGVLCVIILVANRREIPETLRTAWNIMRGRPGDYRAAGLP